MSAKVKKIQPTPTLSGIDAQRIVEEVKRHPSKEAIEKNRRMVQIVRKSMKKA